MSDGLKMREGDQPLPVPNDRPGVQTLVLRDLESARAHGVIYCGHHGHILTLLAQDIEARREVGIQRYGTELQPNNGRDALRDAYEEALDLWMYLRQLSEETPSDVIESLITRAIQIAGTLRARMWDRDVNR